MDTVARPKGLRLRARGSRLYLNRTILQKKFLIFVNFFALAMRLKELIKQVVLPD